MVDLVLKNPHLSIVWLLYGFGVLFGFNAVMKESEGNYFVKLLLVWGLYPLIAVLTPLLSVLCLKTVIDAASQKKEKNKKWKIRS